MVGLVFSILVETSYGLIIPLSTEELYDQSQIIFVGNITAVNILDFEKSSISYIEKDGIETEVIENYTLSLDEYVVNVEEFVKNPQDSSIIKVRQPTTSLPGRIIPVGGFELGDRVLFYTQTFDDFNEYFVSSFKIPKQCDTKKVSDQPRIRFRESFDIFQDGVVKYDNFSEGIPMEFVFSKDLDTLYGGSIDVFVSIRKEGNSQVLFEKDIHSELEKCNWTVPAKWEFTPEEGKYRMYLKFTDNEKSGVAESYTQFTVVSPSPLKQFYAGISFDEIKCKEHLVLIPKYDGSPACVKPESITKLIDRGWAKEDVIPTFEYVIKKDTVTYGSSYQIVGGSVDEIQYNNDSNSLDILLSESGNGYLQILIQNGVLHPTRESSFNYYVLIDGEEVNFEKLSPILLKIPFEKGTKRIEITGSNPI